MCIESVDVQQTPDIEFSNQDILTIVPHLHFSCNGRITSITARVNETITSTSTGHAIEYERLLHLHFQVWRPLSISSYIYSKVDDSEVRLGRVTRHGGNNNYTANVTLTGNSTIEFQSGDVIGYRYQQSRQRIGSTLTRESRSTINIYYYLTGIGNTNGDIKLYNFDMSSSNNLVNLSKANSVSNYSQPLVQFTVGMKVPIELYTAIIICASHSVITLL